MAPSSKQKRLRPQVLKSTDLPSLAEYIKSNKCRNVIILMGAGVSTSAGIPDFRSPETGLYANLARLNLPYPEAVFDISFFRKNPKPFYTLAKEMDPDKFRPTIAHSFIRLLHAHSLLHTCFTQNIDTLERRAGIPGDKLVEAHGSFASQRCINCRTPYDSKKMKEKVRLGETAICEECEGYVKPDIVFFGEALPDRFASSVPNVSKADLLIVMGTSLTVYPFAGLATLPPKTCPRVLINLDRVGDFGSRADDVILLGHCDDVVKQLCKKLGWEDELMSTWAETKGSSEPMDQTSKKEKASSDPDYEEETLKHEVDILAARLAKELTVQEQGATQTERPQNIPKEVGSDQSPTSPSSEEVHGEPLTGTEKVDDIPTVI